MGDPPESDNAAIWDLGAAGYDRVSATLTDAAALLLDAIGPLAGMKLLDIGTGTGIAARMAAARGAQVTAVDISRELLAAGRRIAEGEGARVDFRLGNAEALAFPDACFDRVISSFGVIFAPNAEKTASELARVCRVGGQLALTVWASAGSVAELFRIGRPFRPAHLAAPRGASPFSWGEDASIRSRLSPWFDLSVTDHVNHLMAETPEDLWEMMLAGFGPTRHLYRETEKKAEFRDAFLAFHRRYATADGVDLPRQYRLIAAVRKG